MNYAPNKLSQIAFAIAWFALGYAVANVLAVVIMLASKGRIPMDLLQTIIYPVMFLPSLLYIRHASKKNSVWGSKVPFDRPAGGLAKGISLGLAVCVATFCAGFIGDAAGLLLPPMSEELKQAMAALTEGDILLNVLSTCIMAPVLEEWFCRGVIERGLLISERSNGSKGYGPFAAITVSALIFALIHANIWQGVPAFIFGVLFGYVYYRTGSLKLTMLMHCFNNSLSVFMSQAGIFSGMQSWKEVMPDELFWALIVASTVEIALMLVVVRKAGSGRFWVNE